jgi:large subunit ribosomal protein L21
MNHKNGFYIVEAGGKQIVCKPGDRILIDKIDEIKEGDKIKLKLLFKDNKAINGEIDCHVKDPLILGEKIRIYKTRRRKGYEKTIGFRAKYTMIEVGV